jgi:hypothetical protein
MREVWFSARSCVLPLKWEFVSAFGHFALKVTSRQIGHRRLAKSTLTYASFIASIKLRLEPPDNPTGNNAWTSGRISLRFAFSGRPILAPMNSPALSLIITLETEIYYF